MCRAGTKPLLYSPIPHPHLVNLTCIPALDFLSMPG